MNALVIVLGLALIAIAIIGPRLGGRAGRSGGRSEAELEARLHRMALGDREKVARLIEHERQRNPTGTRRQWIRAAIQRWESDLR